MRRRSLVRKQLRLGENAVLFGQFAYHTARIACGKHAFGHVARNNGACAYHRAFADSHSSADRHVGGYPAIGADRYRFGVFSVNINSALVIFFI